MPDSSFVPDPLDGLPLDGLPPAPERSFASDNAAGAHPAVLAAIEKANHGHALAYGDDDLTRDCERHFAELFDIEVTLRLAFNGTGANILALASALGSLLGPHHAVVCTDWAHIHLDETGAPERALGTKLVPLPCPDAKIATAQLDDLVHLFGVQHHVQPGVVSISQPTELGTLYTADEIAALCDRAHELGMLVHLDGARIANATAALGGDRAALRRFTIDAGVDVVSFGGTKTGALGAEAVVYLNPATACGSEYTRKQVTQLPSKMRFLAAQFLALLDGDLWIELGAQANHTAAALHSATSAIEGIELDGPPAVNSLYPILPAAAIEPLRKWSFFWPWDPTRQQVRWMTAWDTTATDVERFTNGVTEVLARCN
ncbi:MAG: beta-eliminating lyase-related protein [Actinomycetota bacterium]